MRTVQRGVVTNDIGSKRKGVSPITIFSQSSVREGRRVEGYIRGSVPVLLERLQDPDYSGLVLTTNNSRLGVIQSPVPEEELTLGWSTLKRVVPVGLWRRVDNSAALVYGVEVKVHEQ